MKKLNLVGRRFGRLVVLDEADKTTAGKVRFRCRCRCGNTNVVVGSLLKRGDTRSCGCLHDELAGKRSRKNLAGRQFGRLTVLEDVGRTRLHQVIWRCRCSCGNHRLAVTHNLLSGNTRSCGCLAKTNRLTHGHAREHRSPTYVSWCGMLSRCTNRNHSQWKHYGGANPAVKVCDRWNPATGGSFENFLQDMDERPKGTTLGRFGDAGDYEKSNCEWQTKPQQGIERRIKMAQLRRICVIGNYEMGLLRKISLDRNASPLRRLQALDRISSALNIYHTAKHYTDAAGSMPTRARRFVVKALRLLLKDVALSPTHASAVRGRLLAIRGVNSAVAYRRTEPSTPKQTIPQIASDIDKFLAQHRGEVNEKA